MKNLRLSTIGLLLLASGTLQAQYIDVHVGSAFASGSFANNTKAEAGYATNGFTSGISINYLFYKNIGVCTKINYSNFGLDVSSLSAQASKTASVGTSINVTYENTYRASCALVGPYITLGKQHLTVDLRLLVGFLSLSTPQLFYHTTYNGNTYTQTIESTQDAAPAISYGITAKYAFPKNIYLSLHIDNMKANTVFTKNGYQSSMNETITKPYQANLIALGLGYAIQ